jgi:aminomethyltransferase
MAEFGGWEMPIQYRGVLDEHRACREDAALFDVSHLGTVRVSGAGGFDVLQRAFTNDLHRIEPGRAQYTHLLDPDDAHVVDDIIVWWVADEDFLVMPNASNTRRLIDALDFDAPAIGERPAIADITETRAVLAVQGPAARRRLRTVSPEAAEVGRFRVARIEVSGVDCVVAGTGYTGEDGVEIQVPAAAAPDLFDALVGAGITPAGLGARDTLRLEAGLPLHGHELGPGVTPLQANLGWVVRFDKGRFRGSLALGAERERGVDRILRGIAIDGRQPAREGATVYAGDVRVGAVTSGNFSPVLGHAIALAFVTPGLDIGAAVELDVRGRRLSGRIVPLPFVGKRA